MPARTGERAFTDAEHARARDAGELVCQCSIRRPEYIPLFDAWQCGRCRRAIVPSFDARSAPA